MSRVLSASFLLVLAAFLAGCASTGNPASTSSPRIGGSVDTSLQKRF